MLEIVAERISDWRHANGLTQEELARQLNYSTRAIQSWERGDRLPGADALVRLADRMGCTVDHLLGR